MKKHIAAGLLLTALLCCSCSSGGDIAVSEPSNIRAATTQVIPISQTIQTNYADIVSDSWYAEAVNWCIEKDLISGSTDTLFSPNTPMTRAAVADALYRAEGRPAVSAANSFSDVAADASYASAAAWADANSIMSGYGGGLFGPDDSVSREQLAAIFWRYAGSPAASAAGDDFGDEDSIAEYARTAVDWARENGIINGKPGNLFDPKNSITRAEVSSILYRYLTAGDSANSNIPAVGTDSKSTVYMTTDISSDGLMAVYKALEWTPTGNVAVKLSTGEPPASNYLAPDLIKDVVQLVDGTIVECNTAYGGSRATTAMHYQVAKDHGFTDIADVVILDENGSMSLPVEGGSRLTENFVGEHFADYDSYLVLSHFKGHAMAGFGGAIKNISIGLGSSEGKSWIHTGGTSKRGISGDQDAFLESMGEAGKSVVDALDGQIVYINVMNRLSVDCDCSGNPAEPDMHDIGILASTDPVALDQACIDLVYAAADGQSLIRRIESRNGLHTLEHAGDIGLGSREYQLVDVDD